MKPLIEEKNYIVYCAGVRSGPFTQKTAYAYAQKIVREWDEAGVRRGAAVYYRDGSLVAQCTSEGLEDV